MRLKRAAVLAACAALLLTGCGRDGGENQGNSLGEAIQTHFFDYTVNGAYTCGSYGGRAASPDGRFLVVDVTVKNTFISGIEMYDTDFFLCWNGGDGSLAPITTDPETWEVVDVLSQDQLPGVYTLDVDQERTGLLVYEVPAEVRTFAFAYLEQYSDGSQGELHVVYLTPEEASP